MRIPISTSFHGAKGRFFIEQPLFSEALDPSGSCSSSPRPPPPTPHTSALRPGTRYLVLLLGPLYARRSVIWSVFLSIGRSVPDDVAVQNDVVMSAEN